MLGFGIVFVFHFLLLSSCSSSYPSCTNSRVLVKLESPLKFCPYNETSCCNSTEDLRLQREFEAMDISNPYCVSLVRSILCSVCDPSMNMSHPGNFSGLMELHQPKNNFCILNSRSFGSEKRKAEMSLRSSPSMMKTSWPSVSVINPETSDQPPNGLCLEKIGNSSYITMVPHPDGSDRVFLANLQGKIWLANIPKEGSKGVLQVDESKPFLDISDRVLSDIMIGIALHRNFVHNGRFFISYYCDKMLHPGCFGRCSCNTDVDCDPSKIAVDNGIRPCQYHIVIAEYTANGTSSKRRLGRSGNPSEVRRIFTFGIPSRTTRGGQILIGPEDGYLYLMVGDNQHGENQQSFAQNKGSILGKILRLDVDHIPSTNEIHDQGLWGNYSIPKDNPYIDELAPEIFALGLRLPWRCSFDSIRPSFFLCGDLGQDRYEEVDVVIKGGNYGWPVYEGIYPFQPGNNTKGNYSSVSSISPIFPVMGYNHSEVAKKIGSASISGGFIYRSNTDPCLYGRYLYSDLYGHTMWVGTEIPENSGKFTTSSIEFSCSNDSQLQCASSSDDDDSELNFGYIASFAEDNRRDVYLLTSTGVYRVARARRCSYLCAKESNTTAKLHSCASIYVLSWKGVQLYISLSFSLIYYLL